VNDRTLTFVAHHLGRRWPELDHETAWMPLSEVPAARWAPLENIWVVSTYLRLRAVGQNVRIVDRPMPGAINVCCDAQVGRLGKTSEMFLVLTLGDRAPMPWADHCLVQSPVQLCGGSTTLIKHWPQPGLLGRDVSRRDRVERIGYVGPVENLAAAFRMDAFHAELRKLGVELVIRDDPAQWHDFSDLDLFLAVRDWPWHLIRTKPATKLVHAWSTGVPALLGPEPSYQYWGEDGVDYFEVCTPDDVLSVVRRFKESPQLYESIRQRGFEKSKQHDEQAVVRQWIEVLNGPVREAFERWQQAGSLAWKYRALRRRWQRISAPVHQKLFTLRSRGWRAVTKKLRRAKARSEGV